MKNEFKAVIVNEFKTRWIEAVAIDEKCSIEVAIDNYAGDQLDILHDRISGQEVIIVDADGCYFEKTDNNFVLFESLFTRIGGEE